ncbi:hypothetical protein ABB37_00523 [Leptomonas pyrrhocoris]|uniref:Uncharacterized protein n=1 Tax=Leptomonas pyrrhocoris TaxID=157538 RepID=A0A0N0VHP8_LEPPY|nr:hypothetical protein ABB37_00523 [Leptomonas pyrrhocoris]KPA86304.1 hypothetical protein ABB37_00523 [Leptomonas pyrrhocoris]|eukprot:XP_015664743.1 hypothetical protein ABB37_00523 [Leptomonas pyrrhocoris]
MAEPSYVSVLRALCRSITTNEAIRVKGEQEGYRCKATYSLLPRLHVSPLSMRRVNDIATAVGDFCTTRSRISAVAPNFFCEVCVKVSRDDQYMVKLSLLNQRLDCIPARVSQTPSVRSTLLRKDIVASALSVPLASSSREEGSAAETLFDVWLRSCEPYALEDHLRALHPNLAALVAHVCLPAPEGTSDDELHRKPDKNSAYVPLTRNGASAMVEYTPNGHPFWLSADSFCEVNHEMETAIYEAIVEFLRLSPECGKREDEEEGACKSTGDGVSTALPGKVESFFSAGGEGAAAALSQNAVTSSPLHLRKRRAFICGRDINSVVCTFAEYYRGTTVVTTCPCVYADTKTNNISHCIRCAKDQIAEPLRAFALSGSTAEVVADEQAKCDLSNSNPGDARSITDEAPEELHCLITAGRHGLHPNTTTALMELGAAAYLSDLIYVSCNVESLTRDVHVLKETWYIAHARTFDFFPGTDYVMTVLHFRPLFVRAAMEQRVKGGGDLLVLPVGLPGTGKSTCGRALEAFFRSAVNDAGHAEGAGSASAASQTSRPPQEKKVRRERFPASPVCSVPRTFFRLHQRTVRFRHVERDQIFRGKKESASLRVAKQQTHEALLAAVGLWANTHRGEGDNDSLRHAESCCAPQRRVLYLDSTNGSREARMLYQSLWHASSQTARCGSGDGGGRGGGGDGESAPAQTSCVVLFFDSPENAEELLRRVQQRRTHPSFPSAVDDQQRKLEAIAAALREGEGIAAVTGTQDNSTDCAALSETCWHIHASAKEHAVEETIAEVAVTVCAHLLFSNDLAALLRDGALQLLLREKA